MRYGGMSARVWSKYWARLEKRLPHLSTQQQLDELVGWGPVHTVVRPRKKRERSECGTESGSGSTERRSARPAHWSIADEEVAAAMKARREERDRQRAARGKPLGVVGGKALVERRGVVVCVRHVQSQ